MRKKTSVCFYAAQCVSLSATLLMALQTSEGAVRSPRGCLQKNGPIYAVDFLTLFYTARAIISSLRGRPSGLADRQAPAQTVLIQSYTCLRMYTRVCHCSTAVVYHNNNSTVTQ